MWRTNFEKNDNPVYSCQCNSQECMVKPNTPTREEINIISAERKRPYFLPADKTCRPI